MSVRQATHMPGTSRRRLDGPLLRPDEAAALLPSRPAGFTTPCNTNACHAYGSDDTSASHAPCSKTGCRSNSRQPRSRWQQPLPIVVTPMKRRRT
jgi:hypothetical protein